ncbi:MAG: hypothetical protein MUF63_16645 [Rhodobacteraceae bacterium]|jgi:hypothetical protein|nr:hypothetical protein [Paracoccaceae bacterium]
MSARRPDFRRKVFYIPGYDPFPARRYRELYRKESERQAEISGYEIGMFPGERSDTWRVASLIDGKVTEAEVEVLVWSDIVQGSMKQGIVATYGQMLRTAWIYLSTGTFRRLFWLSKGPMVAALYPVVVLLVQLLLAIVAGWVLGGLVAAFTWPVVGWIVGVPVAVAVLRGFRRIDGKLYAHYLMHDYAFSAGRRGATPPELAAREEDFASRIAAALVDDVDEVLVVGHSSGATIAVAVLARLVREEIAGDGERPVLSLLTLGQSIPMVSFLPEAKQLRADLRLLSEQAHLPWVDVSAPGDGCSFALADPVAVSGVGREGKPWPLVMSAAFTQTLAPETLAKLKRRYFRLHFQYLCAFDRPADYDYFRITAGPLTLAERFRGRAPSKSRIDVAVSRYRSVAA